MYMIHIKKIEEIIRREDAHPADVVTALMETWEVRRFGRIALRLARDFMGPNRYQRDLYSVAEDLRILAARLARHTWRTRHTVRVLEQFAKVLSDR